MHDSSTASQTRTFWILTGIVLLCLLTEISIFLQISKRKCFVIVFFNEIVFFRRNTRMPLDTYANMWFLTYRIKWNLLTMVLRTTVLIMCLFTETTQTELIYIRPETLNLHERCVRFFPIFSILVSLCKCTGIRLY